MQWEIHGFHAGAAAVNIDPQQLPVLQNGGFLQQTADKVTQSLYAQPGDGGWLAAYRHLRR